MRYDAPATLGRFMDSDAFVRCCVGPVGSGKSSACVVEILRRACEQEPGPDGVRRSRWAVIRNTYSQLRDTTRKTFEQWVPPRLGYWQEQPFTFVLDFETATHGDVHAEVLFRALDRPEDVKKLLSLELTGAYINEAREIPKNVLDVLQTRVGRYPARRDGGPTWFGVWMDTNPWHVGHWGYKLFSRERPEGYALFEQPGGRTPEAENTENLPDGYYQRLVAGKDMEWVASYVDGKYPSSDAGSVFGRWLAAVESRGGVTEFAHSTDSVLTVWDLGSADSTAIWFVRFNESRNVDVLDYYESSGKGLSHYFGAVDDKGYIYAQHILPHDAKAKTLATQASVFEQCLEHWGAGKVSVLPAMGIEDGIAAGRWLLEQPTRFHARCNVPVGVLGNSGLETLREYRFEWDEKNLCFSKKPLHNWASHGGDAWRYVGLAAKHSELMTRPKQERPRGPVAVPMDRSFRLDELWEAHEQGQGGRERI